MNIDKKIKEVAKCRKILLSYTKGKHYSEKKIKKTVNRMIYRLGYDKVEITKELYSDNKPFELQAKVYEGNICEDSEDSMEYNEIYTYLKSTNRWVIIDKRDYEFGEGYSGLMADTIISYLDRIHFNTKIGIIINWSGLIISHNSRLI